MYYLYPMVMIAIERFKIQECIAMSAKLIGIGSCSTYRDIHTYRKTTRRQYSARASSIEIHLIV